MEKAEVTSVLETHQSLVSKRSSTAMEESTTLPQQGSVFSAAFSSEINHFEIFSSEQQQKKKVKITNRGEDDFRSPLVQISNIN